MLNTFEKKKYVFVLSLRYVVSEEEKSPSHKNKKTRRVEE
jgi:hypothetical protein